MSKPSLFTVFALVLMGCGPSGTVKVALENGDARALTGSSRFALSGTSGTPSAFGIKLSAIYLVEDQENATAEGGWLGNNVGKTVLLWKDPGCVSNLSGESCKNIGFFDLARPTAEVNAALNSQAAGAEAGTYRYIKIALLGQQQGGNNTYVNTRWADDTSSTPEQQYASIQTEWGAPFTTPLTIAAGDAILATLSYDLAAAVYRDSDAQEKVAGQGLAQPGRADDCAGTGGSRICIEFPALTATAVKAP
ncbi:MAG: hypothetical protein FJ086_17990 [Deltaproteobacteria bacterium]|nr:hypothetical protein [Deltaproteobacteria bacterium]